MAVVDIWLLREATFVSMRNECMDGIYGHLGVLKHVLNSLKTSGMVLNAKCMFTNVYRYLKMKQVCLQQDRKWPLHDVIGQPIRSH